MAKSKLLQIVALSAAFTLVGCASTDAQDEGTGKISTEETTDVVAPTETVVEEVAEVVIEEATEVETVVMDAIDRPSVTVVYFDFDKSAIRSEFSALLDLHSEYLMANPDTKLILEGHADERGTREYNLALGERRAMSVSSYLKLRGVSTDQFETVSFGEEKPVAMGKTSEAYSLNRRVEFKYQ